MYSPVSGGGASMVAHFIMRWPVQAAAIAAIAAPLAMSNSLGSHGCGQTAVSPAASAVVSSQVSSAASSVECPKSAVQDDPTK